MGRELEKLLPRHTDDSAISPTLSNDNFKYPIMPHSDHYSDTAPQIVDGNYSNNWMMPSVIQNNWPAWTALWYIMYIGGFSSFKKINSHIGIYSFN